MWERIESKFSKMPSQAEIAKYMLETGIRIEDNKLYFDKVAISNSQLATALGKDKRVVGSTIKTIREDTQLMAVFSKLRPTCNLVDMAPGMNWGVIGIEVCCPTKAGTIGKITCIIGEMGVSIRQAQCPATTNDLLYIITDTPVDSKLISAIQGVENVQKISIFK